VVRRVEAGCRRGTGVACRQPHAEYSSQESHLIHAGIRQHRLRIPLRHTDHDAIEGGKESDGGESSAQSGLRGVERQEADQSDHASLDGCAAHHGRGREGSRRIRKGHPDMQRHEPDLDPESGDQKR